MYVSQFDEKLDRVEDLFFPCLYFRHWTSQLELTICARRSHPKTKKCPLGMVIVWKPEVCQETTFRCIGNRSMMQRSITDVPNSISRAQFSTTLNHTQTQRSPILTKISSKTTGRTAFLAAVRKLRYSVGIFWLQPCRSKTNLFIEFGPAPVSDGHDTIRRQFARVTNPIYTRYVSG